MKKQISVLGFFPVIAVASAFSSALVAPASPEIVTSPTNQTVMAGLPSRMSVVAKSSLPLSYQWMWTRDHVTPRTVTLVNATNSVLVLSNTLATSAGLYSVTVRDASGSVTSDSAHLRILLLQLQPNNQIKLELWNNIRGTSVRVDVTTNMVNRLSSFTVLDALNAQFILGRDLPSLFFHAVPLPPP